MAIPRRQIRRAPVVGGVDTHKDTHVAAVLDELGRLLGTAPFPATERGDELLMARLATHGSVTRVGVEGTGTYGTGLARHLTAAGIEVLEVNRPDRSRRRRLGTSDPLDAESAARAAPAGERTAVPKGRCGPVESIRLLRVARPSAQKARTQAANQIDTVLDTAPDPIRARQRHSGIGAIDEAAPEPTFAPSTRSSSSYSSGARSSSS